MQGALDVCSALTSDKPVWPRRHHRHPDLEQFRPHPPSRCPLWSPLHGSPDHGGRGVSQQVRLVPSAVERPPDRPQRVVWPLSPASLPQLVTRGSRVRSSIGGLFVLRARQLAVVWMGHCFGFSVHRVGYV